MRAEQNVHFAAFSSWMTAAEMEERIGVAADNTMVRGSKDPDRPLPIQHMWEIESQGREQPLYVQIDELLARLGPLEAKLIDLRNEIQPDGGYSFEIVRYLNDPDAEETGTLPLGFGFEDEALQLLVRLGARVVVDEYDCSLGERGIVGLRLSE